MAEPFEFSKHVREIVAPFLKQQGFKKKGNKFHRERGGISEEITFQRSSWNTPGFPYQYYLVVAGGATPSDRFVLERSLRKPNGLPLPDYYEQVRNGVPLTPEQNRVLVEVGKSQSWSYSSEEELRELLALSVVALEIDGLPYLDLILEAQAIEDFEGRHKWIREKQKEILKKP